MKAVYTICFWLLLAALPFNGNAQVLFRYGDKSVDQQEFVQAFLKNNTADRITEETIREYLQLFIRFKLKVAEAYSKRLDTLPNQRAELADFRRQAAESFLNDDNSLRALMKEAFERSLADIDVGMIFFPDSLPATSGSSSARPDSIASRRQAMAAYSELERGMPFKQVAEKYAADAAAKARGGLLGFITVFTLPYSFENIVYALPTGSHSKPVRGGNGYYIFRNVAVRKAVGTRRVRQLLVTVPEGADRAAASRRADSIYRALAKGGSFEQVAHDFWSPSLTSGELPEISVGSSDPVFEASVFALQKDGDIAKPFQTSLGFHVVQLIHAQPVNTVEDNETAMEALKQQLLADPRINSSKQQMLLKINKAVPLRAAKVDQVLLWRYADSALAGTVPMRGPITEKTLLLSVGRSGYSVTDWINFMRTRYRNTVPPRLMYPTLLKDFKDAVATSFYRDHLETYDTGFAAQVKAFREGNLLFEIMQRSVWDKAAADSVALRKYYEAHRANYNWQPGPAAVVFTAADSITASTTYASLKSNFADWRKLVSSTNSLLQADSGRFESAQLSMAGAGALEVGKWSGPVAVTGSEGYIFSYITKLFPDRSPRNFEEARGFVMNDYQVQLEDTWIKSLKTKYPVAINESVVKAVFTRLIPKR